MSIPSSSNTNQDRGTGFHAERAMLMTAPSAERAVYVSPGSRNIEVQHPHAENAIDITHYLNPREVLVSTDTETTRTVDRYWTDTPSIENGRHRVTTVVLKVIRTTEKIIRHYQRHEISDGAVILISTDITTINRKVEREEETIVTDGPPLHQEVDNRNFQQNVVYPPQPVAVEYVPVPRPAFAMYMPVPQPVAVEYIQPNMHGSLAPNNWQLFIPDFKLALKRIKEVLESQNREEETEDVRAMMGETFMWLPNVGVLLLAQSQKLILFANAIKPGDGQYQEEAERIQLLFNGMQHSELDVSSICWEIMSSEDSIDFSQLAVQCRLFGGKIASENRTIISALTAEVFRENNVVPPSDEAIENN